MKILLDECVPRPIKKALSAVGHECTTVPDAGLGGKTNGDLLRLAERQFDVFLTLDKGIRFQQDLRDYQIGVLVIRANSSRVADILPHIPECLTALRSIRAGSLVEIGP